MRLRRALVHVGLVCASNPPRHLRPGARAPRAVSCAMWPLCAARRRGFCPRQRHAARLCAPTAGLRVDPRAATSAPSLVQACSRQVLNIERAACGARSNVCDEARSS